MSWKFGATVIANEERSRNALLRLRQQLRDGHREAAVTGSAARVSVAVKTRGSWPAVGGHSAGIRIGDPDKQRLGREVVRTLASSSACGGYQSMAWPSPAIRRALSPAFRCSGIRSTLLDFVH